ncbi:TolC family protein [Nevskia ramosa]|uniref:TolC family protein n=1 Tax=Nevskia ramosa TaxID=64002 RepID=UPI003D135151
MAAGLSATPFVLAQETGALAEEETAPIVTDAGLSLATVVDAALARAPGTALLAVRNEVAASTERRSGSFIAGAPSVQLRYLSDRPTTRQGVTESEAGIDLPLWRWGQRAAVAMQARANQSGAVEDARLHRWRVAGMVREAYWDVRDAQARLTLAERDVAAFLQLEKDVIRRINAGDAAPGERLTAEGQRREREAIQHETEVMLADRFFGWRELTGYSVLPGLSDERPAPEVAAYLPLDAAKAEEARTEAALDALKAEGSGSPRLLLLLRRDTQNGMQDIDSVAAQVSLPFGGSSHRQVALSPLALDAARARDTVAQMEREARLAHHEAEHELHAREIALHDAAGRYLLAMDEVALARRAYALGEVPLSERLLTEIRAADTTRAHQLAVIAYSRAIARYNQINGVSP